MLIGGVRRVSDRASEALAAALAAYAPCNEQEARDAAEIVRRLRGGENLWTRENASAHLTASAWIVSPDRTRTLMCFHKLYRSWSWLGGHADGETDLLAVALREAREESGLKRVRPVTPEPFSVEILTVDGHEKRGLAWFGLDEAVERSAEPWFRERIYSKLNAKLRALYR